MKNYTILIAYTDWGGNIYAWISKTLSNLKWHFHSVACKKGSDGDEGKHYLNINFEKKYMEVNRENINQTGWLIYDEGCKK